MPDGSTLVILDPIDSNAEFHAGAFLASFSSADTRHAYRMDLRRWLEWCASHGVHPYQGIRRTHGELYLRELEQLGLAKATRARRIGTVISWFRWLVDEEVIEASQLERVRRPQVDRESPRTALSRGELHDLLAAAEASSPTDYALCCLLAIQGLRVSEACRVDIEHIGVSGWHHTLVLPKRKGDKRQQRALAPQTMHAINQAIGDRTAGAVLLNRWGQRMNRENALRVVSRVGREAGVRRHVHPHLLRHTFVTLALRAGVPLHVVQFAAGHADPSTTIKYARAIESLDADPSALVSQYVAGAG